MNTCLRSWWKPQCSICYTIMKSSCCKMGSKFNLHVRISEEKNNSLIWLHKAALTMVVVAHVSDVAYGLIIFPLTLAFMFQTVWITLLERYITCASYYTYNQIFFCFDRSYCGIHLWSDYSCTHWRMNLYFSDINTRLKVI